MVSSTKVKGHIQSMVWGESLMDVWRWDVLRCWVVFVMFGGSLACASEGDVCVMVHAH